MNESKLLIQEHGNEIIFYPLEKRILLNHKSVYY